MVFFSIFITILILQKLRFSVKVYKNIKQLFYKAHLSSSVNIIYTIACFTKRRSVASSSPANDFPCLQPITTQSAVDSEPFYLWNDLDRCFLNIPQLSKLFVAAVTTRLKRFAGTYLLNSMKLLRLNIKYIDFVVFSVEYMSRRII